MTKREIVERIAKATGMNLKQSSGAMDAVFDSIKVSLKRGKKITIPGFGTFYMASRKARKGRNPRTGELIKIAASKLPKFRAGKNLKDLFKRK
jgi:DNA-binding protein HU-beta